MRYLPILWLILLPSLAMAVDLEGRSDFARRVELNSSLSGRIDSVRVRTGQRVVAGETVVTLVTTGLEAAAAMARARVDGLRPLLARAETELEKAEELYARDSLAQVELQIARQDHTVAAARLAAAEAELANANYRLSQAEIRTPIDGMVIEVTAQRGIFINTRVENRTLVVIADVDRMIASASLPAVEARDSLLGQSATVRYGERLFSGKVIELGRQATLGNDGAATITVRVAIETGGELPSGAPVSIGLSYD